MLGCAHVLTAMSFQLSEPRITSSLFTMHVSPGEDLLITLVMSSATTDK